MLPHLVLPVPGVVFFSPPRSTPPPPPATSRPVLHSGPTTQMPPTMSTLGDFGGQGAPRDSSRRYFRLESPWPRQDCPATPHPNPEARSRQASVPGQSSLGSGSLSLSNTAGFFCISEYAPRCLPLPSASLMSSSPSVPASANSFFLVFSSSAPSTPAPDWVSSVSLHTFSYPSMPVLFQACPSTQPAQHFDGAGLRMSFISQGDTAR